MWPSKEHYERIKHNFNALNINTANLANFNESRYTSLLQEMRNLQWDHLSDEQKHELRALIEYEKGPTRDKLPMNTETVENRIRSILERQPPLEHEITVWRGHYGRPKHILPISWFSTSSNESIALKYKTGSCCLFKIHVQPGVRIIDLYKLYLTYGIENPYKEQRRLRSLFRDIDYWLLVNYATYGEIIVEEGGTFYKDPERKEKGFKPINTKKTSFETWYFPKEEGYQYRQGVWDEDLFE